VLNSLSVSGLLTYNSSTGVLGYTSSSLALGTASHNSSSDFLASSTVYVTTVNGQSGAVTINGVATTTINGTQAAVFRIVGDGTTVTSTVSGATTTFSILTTGNWIGTWQGVNSSTFYLATNPNHYISSSTASTLYYPLTGNPSGFLTSAPATTTVNGQQCAAFTFSTTATTSPSSVTTTTCALFINLLTYSSGTDINVSSNGVINFVNTPGYLTAAVTSVNGNSNAAQTFTGGTGISVSSSGGNTTTTNTGVTSFTGAGCVTAANSTGTVTLSVTCAGSGGVASTTPFTAGNLVVVSSSGALASISSSTYYLSTNPSGYITTSTNNFGGITTSTYNASITISTAAPLGGGGQLSNNGTLNLTCATCISTSTFNATGTTGSGAYFIGSSTLASTNIQYVPANFATAGCAGSSTATTLNGCINAIYSSQSALASTTNPGGVTIWITNSVTSTWTGEINFNINGLVPSLKCTAGVSLVYTGIGNAYAGDFNFGNFTGHVTSDDSGCIYKSNIAGISAGQTNLSTTTAWLFGGSNGAVGVNFHDNTVNGFQTAVEVGQNAYMDSWLNNSFSGGNGGQANRGSEIQIDTANNSGESLTFGGNLVTDPGNSSSSNCINVADNGVENLEITGGGAVDDCQIRLGISENIVNIDHIDMENAAYGTYGKFPYIIASSSGATVLNVDHVIFANDANTSGNSPPEFVEEAVNFSFNNNTLDLYGTAPAMTNAVDHTLNPGQAVEGACANWVQNGVVSNILPLSGTPYPACITEYNNSYPVYLSTGGNNVGYIVNGQQNVATFDNNGNWTFLNNVKVGGALNVTSTATFQAALTQLGGSVSLASTSITGAASTTGNFAIGGTLNVTATTTLLGVTEASGTQYYSLFASSSANASQTTINWNNSNVQELKLTTSTTITFTNTNPGARYILMLLQDATGSRTVTWPSTVQWAAGTAPTLTTTASKMDIITFVCASVSSTDCYGGANLNYSP
jgi:hypothetical protein